MRSCCHAAETHDFCTQNRVKTVKRQEYAKYKRRRHFILVNDEASHACSNVTQLNHARKTKRRLYRKYLRVHGKKSTKIPFANSLVEL